MDLRMQKAIKLFYPYRSVWLSTMDGWFFSRDKKQNIQLLSSSITKSFKSLDEERSLIVNYIIEIKVQDKPDHLIYKIDKRLAEIVDNNR